MDGGSMGERTFIPDTESTRAFRDALGRFATGVCVITTQGPEGPMGFTANSFTSLSLDPPLVLWSPARASSRFAVFAAAQDFAIHVLAEGQGELMRRFVRGGTGFEGLPAAETPEGVPVIGGALARFDCRRHATHDGGDHLIVVGLVRRFALAEGAPLVFSAGRTGRFQAD